MAFERIEQEIARLESADEITPDDLQRFREVLPTDPERAKVLDKALPWPWGGLFEYVSPSERQSGYWRLAPDRTRPRSEAERETWRRFSEAAKKATGTKGTAKRGGKEVPTSAAFVGDELKGRRISRAKAKRTGQKTIKRLKELVS